MRETIRIIRKGKVVDLTGLDPRTMLLDYLRLGEKATGTKEGCNEGDCGACTVAVGSLVNGAVSYRPVNACIQMVGQLDGAEIITVEDLADGDRLHPVQSAMVEAHGSQCGFCTPGIVMSLFTLYHNADEAVAHADVTGQLQGNLCRCTGYRPITDAARAAITGAPDDRFSRSAPEKAALLASLADGEDIFIGTDESFFAAPAGVASLARLYERFPDATIVAGATDVGLWVTKHLKELKRVIHLGRVAGLKGIEDGADYLKIGAGVTYAEAEAALGSLDADVAATLQRIGSRQVRASGTIGGNIANGSPIGDTPPLLIALDASLTLRKGDGTRRLPLEDFFITYGRQDRAPGEFVAEITIPKLKPGEHFRAYKNSKRFDQDISAVMAAFRLTVEAGRITAARLAFGGMAGTPKRATAAEKALIGASLADEAGWTPALEALESDFQPLTDMRASAAYRRRVARALLLRALVEISGTPTFETRVTAIRETEIA